MRQLPRDNKVNADGTTQGSPVVPAKARLTRNGQPTTGRFKVEGRNCMACKGWVEAVALGLACGWIMAAGPRLASSDASDFARRWTALSQLPR